MTTKTYVKIWYNIFILKKNLPYTAQVLDEIFQVHSQNRYFYDQDKNMNILDMYSIHSRNDKEKTNQQNNVQDT